jgi:lipopolysaccharide export system permease protein
VVEEGGDSTAALLRYSLLRAPLVANKLVPFTALIAALVVLTRLVRNSELTAIRAAGVSQLQLMVALLPAALLIAAPQFVLDGWVAPKAVESLRAWGVGEYDRDIDDELTWLRDGNDMVRIRFIDSERGVLHGVTILERNESGDFERQIQATTARFESGRWTLRDVTISEPRKPQPERQAEMVWNTTVGPAMFSAFSEHPSEMNFTRLVQFLENPAYGNRPQYLYETWFHKRLALPATTILIILLCIPLVQRFERTAGTATMILGGVGLGFLYLSFDGVILSIGEAGLLPATFAAWVPTLILMCITGSIAFYFEYHR